MGVSTNIVGIGHYLPSEKIENSSIQEWTGKDPSWTESKTGIASRTYAEDDESVVDMALESVKEALKSASLEPRDLHGIICSTSTASRIIPSTASELAGKLGIEHIGPTFDVNAVCSGWVFAACIANSLLFSGAVSGPIAVVASDAYSRIMNRDDPTTVSLFGDGSACAIIDLTDGPYRILGDAMRTAPSGWEYVKTQEHLIGTQTDVQRPVFSMDGPEVVSLANEIVPSTLKEALDKAQVSIDTIDHFIFHQGNVRMVTGLAEAMNLPTHKVHIFSDETGNLASASAPTTLSQTKQAGQLSRGDTVALITIGGGVTAGAMVLQWSL